MLHLYLVEFELGEWELRDWLLVTRPRLIWKPGRDWRSALARLEASPASWPGPDREPGKTPFPRLSPAEYSARLRQALQEIEGQEM